MEARPRSWWQTIRRLLAVVGIIVACVLGIALIVGIIGEYLFHWNWTGFNGNNKSGKTLWDWMQLLFIPVVLAVAGFWFNHRERKAAELRAENERKAAELRAEAEREIERQRAEAEREIAEDNQQEAAMQAYINEMSELLLHEKLRKSKPEGEARNIARVRTLTVLPRLDGKRKRSVLQFLHESGLIEKDNAIVDLRGADLQIANLRFADLDNSRLDGANLSNANLNYANLARTHLAATRLYGANLAGTFLKDAVLQYALLEDADLSGANLSGAHVTIEQLDKARLLEGATMPDGSKHP